MVFFTYADLMDTLELFANSSYWGEVNTVDCCTRGPKLSGSTKPAMNISLIPHAFDTRKLFGDRPGSLQKS